MLGTGITFLFTLLTIFCSYQTFFMEVTSMFHTTVSYILWSFYFNTFILYVITMGNMINNQAKRTEFLLSRIINRIRNPDTIIMLQSFAMQVSQRSPSISCGLFTFDWSLLFSMVASATAYMVILIQVFFFRLKKKGC